MGAERKVEKLKVFISYSRRDATAADTLVEALTNRGFEVKIDTRDLPFGEEWQLVLAEFIRLSDTVIWLVSVNSSASKWVNWELDEVKRRSKRLVPVMIGDTSPETLPRQLGEIHILPVGRLFEPARDLDTLVEVLETDHAWLKEASRLQDRAAEWITHGRISGRLLTPSALKVAERWKDNRPTKAPPPAQEVLDLMLASRQAATRRQRLWVGGSLVVALVAIGLAAFANIERNRAIELGALAETRSEEATAGRDLAIRDARAAREQTRLVLREAGGEMRFVAPVLVDEARRFADAGDHATAAAIALEVATAPSIESMPAAIAGASTQLYRVLQYPLEFRRKGHSARLRSAAYSHDYARVVTVPWDGEPRVWNALNGHQQAVLGGHLKRVTAAAFSHSGTLLVTASEDATARIWNSTTGQSAAVLIGHSKAVNGATFSPNNKSVVTSSEDGECRIWDVETGRTIVVLSGHKESVVTAAFSSDGQYVVTGSSDSTASIWDAKNGQRRVTLKGHRATVFSAEFSRDGNHVITTSWDETARVWNSSNGQLLATIPSSSKAVISIDGTRVLSASGDVGVAFVVNVATGQQLITFSGHTGLISGASFSSDAKHIVTSSSKDGTARVWEVATGQELITIRDAGIIGAVFNSNGLEVITHSVSGTLRFWKVPKRQLPNQLASDASYLTSVAFSPDGKRLVGASGDGTATVWDIMTGNKLVTLYGHTSILRASFSPDGNHIATAFMDGSTVIWNSSTGRSTNTLIGHTGWVNDARYSPDGLRIITASGDQTARIWDANTARTTHVMSGHTDLLTDARFSSDSTRVVTASRDGTARIWDALSGKLLITLAGHSSGINTAAFSRDGSRVLTSSSDNTAKIWDATTGLPLVEFVGHFGAVHVAEFSPDGSRIITAASPSGFGNTDSSIRLWNAVTGSELFRLEGSKVQTVQWNPATSEVGAAHQIASALGNTVRFTNIYNNTDALADVVKSRVPTCLTLAQRDYYFLPLGPPSWCVTGLSLGTDARPEKWQAKWPYQSYAWNEWLLAKLRGNDVPLPASSASSQPWYEEKY